MKSPKALQKFGEVLLAIAFLAGCSTPLATPTVPPTFPPPPIPTTTNEYIANLLKEIRYYQYVLEGDLSPRMRKSVEYKLAYAEAEATRQSIITRVTKDPNTTIEIIWLTDPPFQTGIFEFQGAEIKPSVAKINNRWHGIVNDEYVIVFAGALAKDKEQGVVYVWRMYKDKGTRSWITCLTLQRVGSVRIIEVRENRLILNTEAGDVLYFDVSGEKFVSSLEEIVETITPIPINVPTEPLYKTYP